MSDDSTTILNKSELRDLVAELSPQINESEFGLKDVVRNIRLYKRRAILTGLIAAALAVLYSFGVITPVYTASSSLLIMEREDGWKQESYLALLHSGDFGDYLVESLPPEILSQVANSTGVEPRKSLEFGGEFGLLSVSSRRNSELVTLRAACSDPELANKLVNAVTEKGEIYMEQRERAALQEELKFAEDEYEEFQGLFSEVKKELTAYIRENNILLPGRSIILEGYQFFENEEGADFGNLSAGGAPAKRALESDVVFYELSTRFQLWVERSYDLESDIAKLKSAAEAPSNAVQILDLSQIDDTTVSPKKSRSIMSVIFTFFGGFICCVAFSIGFRWLKEIED